VPRLDLVDPDRLPEEHRALVARVLAERGTSSLYRLLLHSPTFTLGWLDFSNAVRFRGTLGAPLQELVILRVGLSLRASYEWSQHVVIARRAGVTDAQIDDLGSFADSPHFSEREKAALAYAVVVTEQVRVPDAVFERVRAHFSAQEIVELTITVGFYNNVCRFLIALQLDTEPGLEPPPFEPAR
jgi:alkylhydroperoxidase family enzyme